MRDRVEEFLVRLSERFTEGDVDGIMDCLAMPTAVYFGADMIMLSTREEVAQLTAAYMGELEANGMTKGPLSLRELTVSEGGKITAVATARMADAEGTAVVLSRTKYFLREEDGCLKVELTEHSQVALEEDLIHAPLANLAI
ncbi:nuclear transport factor 2 family protein [Vannielia litorea]|uniref:nuclear transport factor 2 family protein n=1 Tax=Vannielia litorea TaxID=1217970 RepID=UPI001C975660|nr:nuclear transport factor 2 family protein [Vannielia litorea]MBY6046640.1 nuclear transport factor 2 family protein [Vannielia litorea]MBY6074054.1 nuclear transport factor 2 family protein [Vannielia litorea]